ncbi:unnamed protein product [Cunninghamella echinulata]
MAFGFFSESFSDQGTMDNGTWQFCGLSRMERLYAFGACFVIGFILSIVSSFILMGGNIAGFAILYSIGNLISIFSLTFIIGILKQVKTMFAPVRFWATTVYLSLLILTLVLSLLLKNFIISLVLVIVQFCALVWYSASYIPYGREIIRRFFGSCVTSI